MTKNIAMRGLLAVSFYTGVSFCSILSAAAQMPSGKTSSVSIPAGKLSTALNIFAARFGVQIGVDTSVVRDRNTPGLSGNFTPAEGIGRLLQGTDLQYRFIGADMIAITANPPASSEADGTTVLETIYVTGRGFGRFNGEKSDSYDQAQSAYFVDEETLSRMTGSSPSDMLKGIPGIYTGEARTGGGIDPNIRGLQGQKRVKMTVDGAENSIDVYRGYAGRQDRNYIDPDFISSVSVSKGPAPSLDAIGGTIAMSTIRPEDILIDGQEIGVRIKGSVASNSASMPGSFQAPQNTDRNSIFEPQTGNGSAAFAVTQDNFDVVAAYARRDNGNYFAGSKGRDKYRVFRNGQEQLSVASLYPESGEVFNSSNETESALLKLTLRPFDDHTLDLGYRYFDARAGEIMSSNILRNSTGYIPQWDPSTVNSDSLTARYKWNPEDNDLIDLTANFAYSHLEYDGYLTLGSQTPSDKPACNDDPFSERCYKRFYGASRIIETTSFDIANTSKIDTEIGQFKANYGTSLRFEKLFPPADAPSEANGRQISGGFHQQADRQQFDTFGTATWEPNDRLTLSLGGRFTKFKTYDHNRGRGSETYSVNRKQINLSKNVMQYELLEDENFELVPDGNGWYKYDYSKPTGFWAVPRGTAYWYTDADGNYTDATDPRKSPDGKAYPSGGFQEDVTPMVPVSTIDYDDSFTTFTQDKLVSERTRTVYYDNLRRRDAGFAPSINGSYEVFEGWKLHAAYTNGIRMPSITESSVGGASASAPANLLPEQARNLELGVSTRIENIVNGDDSLMARLSYFDNKTKDYITRHDAYNEASYTDQARRKLAREKSFSFYNADSFSVKGLELQVAYDNGTFFTDMSANYNLSTKTCAPDVAQLMVTMSQGQLGSVPNCVDGGFSGAYTNAQNPPQYTLSGTFGARSMDDTLEIATRVTHTSAPTKKLDQLWNRFGGVATQLTYQPVTLFDVSATYKISEKATAGFSVENLFDRYYLDPLALSMMPGPGRTFKASLTMRF
ncbi:TonB-dependent receptor [Agrobacterium rosae]|uniref:TonB-dependent receptor n=1 Tax=Agrobacterium rosae TaxID=1972867 RepID=UPI0019D3B687|nr:TonB-dependent receptor [Agrobacterium rosae]MBN7808378.1 TonB-dependent receptor [Agrobacterium rosae]